MNLRGPLPPRVHPQGPGLPNQSTKLQNSNFPKYKRTLHHAAMWIMWMRTKHVKQGALAYHR